MWHHYLVRRVNHPSLRLLQLSLSVSLNPADELSAGVDLPYMLFADQLGEVVQDCRARVGVTWLPLITDFPTGIPEVLRGRQDRRAYVRSLVAFDVEALFSWGTLLRESWNSSYFLI
jgi:hypothetical protein